MAATTAAPARRPAMGCWSRPGQVTAQAHALRANPGFAPPLPSRSTQLAAVHRHVGQLRGLFPAQASGAVGRGALLPQDRRALARKWPRQRI